MLHDLKKKTFKIKCVCISIVAPKSLNLKKDFPKEKRLLDQVSFTFHLAQQIYVIAGASTAASPFSQSLSTKSFFFLFAYLKINAT